MSTIKIIEVIDCPLCDGKISVIVEDNVITSHGICPKCDRPFSPDHMNFAQECRGYEDEFMAEEGLFRTIEDEIYAFNMLVWDVFFDELYQAHLDEMGEC